MFKLVIQDDEGKTTVVPLIRDEITIGRKEGNTIRLTERNVSRRHARIVRANGAVAIEDLGSYNGVRVNGTRIAQRTSLSVSDRVQIGDYLIELKAEGVEQATDDGKTQPIERMDPNFIDAQMATAATMPPGPVPGTAGPPTPVVALADTDPAARAIPAIAPVPIGQTSGHARLVVLSSNFAGQDWELSRAQMIIGRTDDNDIVVNHRSISRNHAKFVREPDTGRYTISDLQSSNGVRVNGEEYGKVELRRGDVIDLGHVRLRFVEPGEDFLFGRDAQIADVPTGARSKGVLIAAAALIVAIGGVVIYMVTRPEKTPVVSENPDGSDGSDGSATVMLTADAAPQVAVTFDAAAEVDPPPTDVGKKLAECRAFRDNLDWLNLNTCAKKLQEIDPKNPDAAGLIEQAKREAPNNNSAEDLKLAAGKKDYQAAIAKLKEIEPDSVYYEKAKAIHDKLKQDYVAEQVAWGRARADKHDCKSIDIRAKQVHWKEAADALGAVPCDKPPPPDVECRKNDDCGDDKICNSKNKCIAKLVTPPDPGDKCDAAVLLDEAKAAGGANQWSKMLSKAEASNKCSASRSARQLALLAACRLGNRDKAAKYWKEFENNAMSKQQCVGVVP